MCGLIVFLSHIPLCRDDLESSTPTEMLPSFIKLVKADTTLVVNEDKQPI